jgi:hypothetical protein
VWTSHSDCWRFPDFVDPVSRDLSESTEKAIIHSLEGAMTNVTPLLQEGYFRSMRVTQIVQKICMKFSSYCLKLNQPLDRFYKSRVDVLGGPQLIYRTARHLQASRHSVEGPLQIGCHIEANNLWPFLTNAIRRIHVRRKSCILIAFPEYISDAQCQKLPKTTFTCLA